MACVADDTSVLIKLESLLEIKGYIQIVYFEYQDKIYLYFKIQFINVDNDRILNILSHYQKVNRRLNYQNSSESINET